MPKPLKKRNAESANKQRTTLPRPAYSTPNGIPVNNGKYENGNNDQGNTTGKTATISHSVAEARNNAGSTRNTVTAISAIHIATSNDLVAGNRSTGRFSDIIITGNTKKFNTSKHIDSAFHSAGSTSPTAPSAYKPKLLNNQCTGTSTFQRFFCNYGMKSVLYFKFIEKKKRIINLSPIFGTVILNLDKK